MQQLGGLAQTHPGPYLVTQSESPLQLAGPLMQSPSGVGQIQQPPYLRTQSLCVEQWSGGAGAVEVVVEAVVVEELEVVDVVVLPEHCAFEQLALCVPVPRVSLTVVPSYSQAVIAGGPERLMGPVSHFMLHSD